MTLNQGCGRRRYDTEFAAAKAVDRGAEGSPDPCMRGGVLHWHLIRQAAVPVRQSRYGSDISREVRATVLARDGHACVCCGVSIIGRHYSLGHRRRASQGGRAVPSNLLTFLGLGGELCHGRIDLYRDPADAAKGYRVESWQDPALVPVMFFSPHGSGFTAWLADSGELLFDPPEGVTAA